MFPPDDVLLARGKYSTLSHERRDQLERVQKTLQTLMTCAQQALRDCEGRPPSNGEPLATIGRCLENTLKARVRLIEISNEMEELHPQAWGKALEPAPDGR